MPIYITVYITYYMLDTYIKRKGGKMENLKAFEKHQEKVIQEMHERYLIFYKKKKKKRF